ncbi:MAG: hypothetical protein EOO63_13055 [Hymenobacter sp.]|nr:MAG: hypothetical protein EOO63_13055 [Hymenobacter sp.]
MLDNDTITAICALIAIAVSLTALFIGEYRQIEQKRLNSLQANGTLLVEAWKQVAVNPSVLRFHSIDIEKLKAEGFSVEELSYLLVLFEAADFHYQHVNNKSGPFPIGSLRYALLASPETRRAWPFLKPFLVASKRYVRKIEETISFINNKEALEHKAMID